MYMDTMLIATCGGISVFRVRAPKEAGSSSHLLKGHNPDYEAKTIYNCRANRKRRAEELVYLQRYFTRPPCSESCMYVQLAIIAASALPKPLEEEVDEELEGMADLVHPFLQRLRHQLLLHGAGKTKGSDNRLTHVRSFNFQSMADA